MRTVAKLGFGVATAAGVCIAAASVASLVMAKTEARGIAGIDSPDLWTTSPVKIDPLSQHYERVPAVLTTYALTPPKITRVAHVDTNPAVTTQTAAANLTEDHTNWCAGRYSSYDSATNSYRAYSGEIRTCVSPFGASSVSSDDTHTGNPVAAAVSEVAAWCEARYKSYRPADNTYQPHGGSRRICLGPKTKDEMASAF